MQLVGIVNITQDSFSDGGAGVPMAVDSYRAETQRFAAARGVAYLNDIQGFPDPSRYEQLAELSCRLVVMHSVQGSGPATKVWTDPREIWARIERFFDE